MLLYPNLAGSTTNVLIELIVWRFLMNTRPLVNIWPQHPVPLLRTTAVHSLCSTFSSSSFLSLKDTVSYSANDVYISYSLIFVFNMAWLWSTTGSAASFSPDEVSGELLSEYRAGVLKGVKLEVLHPAPWTSSGHFKHCVGAKMWTK